MDSLRLILMLVGAAIILAVYLHSRFKKDSNKKFLDSGFEPGSSLQSAYDNSKVTDVTGSTNDANVIEKSLPDNANVIVDPSVYSFGSNQVNHGSLLDDELSELARHIKIDDSDPVVERQSAVGSFNGSAPDQKQDENQKGGLVEKVMVIYLLAQPGRKFSGGEIKRIAKSERLQFGADYYFHRYSNTRDKTGSIFGIANILEPGLFDAIDSEDFSTPGLVFFQQLSNAGAALEAFDEMLKSVIQFKEQLDGHLQDSSRNPLNKKAMIKLREQVSAFSLKKSVSPF